MSPAVRAYTCVGCGGEFEQVGVGRPRRRCPACVAPARSLEEIRAAAAAKREAVRSLGEIRAAAVVRRAAVMELRASGRSCAAIARELGVSSSGVRKDLAVVAACDADATPARVVGVDGKSYAAASGQAVRDGSAPLRGRAVELRRAGVSCVEIAERLGVSRAAASRWTQGVRGETST